MVSRKTPSIIKREYDIAQIDAKIDQLDDPVKIRHLQSARNRLCAVSRLPTETIANIFQIARDTEIMEEEYASNRWFIKFDQRPWHWTTVTHVCGAWRDIAIGCHYLWNILLTGRHANPSIIQLHLKRSGNLQLELIHDRGPMFTSFRLESLKLVLEEIKRIRVLKIFRSIGNLKEAESLKPYFSKPAPALQKVVMHNFNGYDAQLLFGGHVPNLKSLNLMSDSRFWFGSTLLRGLTTLRLINITETPTPQEILQILESNPDLTSLELSFKLVSGRLEKLFPTQERISLPSLSSFTIHYMDFALLAHILGNIDTPQAVSFHIACDYFPVHNLPLIFPTILNRDKSCQTLNITLSGDFILIGSDPEYPTEHAPAESTLHFRWEEFGTNSNPVSLELVFEAIYMIIKNQFWNRASEVNFHIHSKSFRNSSLTLNIALWTKLLAILPRLDTVRIHGLQFKHVDKEVADDVYSGFVEALAKSELITNNRIFPCPNLSEISLYDFNLDDAKLLPKLIDCLRLRSEHGMKLKHLTLCNAMYINMSTIGLLQNSKFVDKIDYAVEKVVDDEDEDD